MDFVLRTICQGSSMREEIEKICSCGSFSLKKAMSEIHTLPALDDLDFYLILPLPSIRQTGGILRIKGGSKQRVFHPSASISMIGELANTGVTEMPDELLLVYSITHDCRRVPGKQDTFTYTYQEYPIEARDSDVIRLNTFTVIGNSSYRRPQSSAASEKEVVLCSIQMENPNPMPAYKDHGPTSTIAPGSILANAQNVVIKGGNFTNIIHTTTDEHGACVVTGTQSIAPPSKIPAALGSRNGEGIALPLSILGLQMASISSLIVNFPDSQAPPTMRSSTVFVAPSTVYVALHFPDIYREMKIMISPFLFWIFVKMWIHRRATVGGV